MKVMSLFLLCLLSLGLVSAATIESNDDDIYRIGVGIADITGPAAEVNLMGYARFGQDSGGIHTRLYARTFIVQDKDGNRVVYISADAGMIDQAIKTQVAATLKEKYDGLYTTDNILISGTHTHSGPGGFLQYLLYTIVSQGFTKQTFDAMVNGIVLSVDRAHQNPKLGNIYWTQGELSNASINRSPSAYLNNSAEERSKYKYNTDNDFYQLKFTDTNNQPLGLLNWFAVHPTSMNNSNSLISGDNKGQASLMFENYINPEALPGKNTFVAAFASANLGDVSPNLKGPRCLDTGEPCDVGTSTCGGKNEMCIASGPGKDMYESTKIIAERQFTKALELFNSTTLEKVSGPVAFVHQHVDMTNVTVTRPDGSTVTTCKPAMGYSFAAGTIDGPGAFDFRQGTTTGNTFWNLVRDFIAKPNKEMIECQKPKPILLATGLMNFPYPWAPQIVPTQMFRIGKVIIAAVPGEFTTMSGRRLKELITSELLTAGMGNTHVVLAGLSNAYSSYVATYEEYQIQRYEGASTIFGPHTLEAYLQQYRTLSQSLTKGEELPSGPDPPNLLNRQISLRPGVVFDSAGGKNFGDVIRQPNDFYVVNETVTATFVAGHPRNNLMQENSFLLIEKLDKKSGQWVTIATDGSLDTKFSWKRLNALTGTSQATVDWEIPPNALPGLYRITHKGAHKTLFQQIKPYQGTTTSFTVGEKGFFNFTM